MWLEERRLGRPTFSGPMKGPQQGGLTAPQSHPVPCCPPLPHTVQLCPSMSRAVLERPLLSPHCPSMAHSVHAVPLLPLPRLCPQASRCARASCPQRLHWPCTGSPRPPPRRQRPADPVTPAKPRWGQETTGNPARRSAPPLAWEERGPRPSRAHTKEKNSASGSWGLSSCCLERAELRRGGRRGPETAPSDTKAASPRGPATPVDPRPAPGPRHRPFKRRTPGIG